MVVSKINIKKATIYGFGKWIDYSIDFSKESFICIYGENESGKSTIQNFVLFMLFGLPPKKRAFYRPKTSGKMGGRLVISDPEIGDYTIERLDEVKNGAAACYLSDGQAFGDEWLKDRLKGMTSEIYQSIFSFSALDLNHFTAMKDEDLGEILLGIGLTGSNNIYTIEKKLDQKIGGLFKPTGKIPTINQQLESLDERFIELTNYQNNEATYQNKQEQVNVFKNEIDKLQIKLQQTRAIQFTIERRQHHLPVISDYHLYTNQLSNVPLERPFPENGLERLHALKEKLLPIQSEYSVLEVNQTQNKMEYEKLQKKLIDVVIYDDAQAILKKEQQFNKDKQELARLEEAIHTLDIKMDTALNELNIGLTLEVLTQISLPFYTEAAWKEIKNKADQLKLEKEQLQRDQQTLRKQQHFLSNQLEDIKDKLLTAEQQDELYLQLDTYKEHDYLSKLANESSQKKIKWEKSKQGKEKQMKSLLIGSIFLGLLTGGTGLLLDISFLYNIMAIILIIGLGQWIWGKKSIKETSALLESHEPVGNLTSKITESQKQEAEQLLIQDDENRSILLSLKDQLKSIDIQFIQWNEKQHTLEQDESKLAEQIDIQHDHYPFLEHIDIRHWPDFFHTIKQLLDILHEKKTSEQQAEKHQDKLTIYGNLVKDFLKKIDKNSINYSSELQLEIIKNIVIKYDDSQRSLQQYFLIMTENDARQADIRQKMKVYEQEIHKLFAIAQVETEDEFYKIEKVNQERQAIEKKINNIADQLQAVFSQSDWQELTKSKPDQSKLEVDHQQIIQQCEALEKAINVNRQHLADLNADLMNMESSEVYSNTMHHFSMEKEQLTKLAKEWATLKTAKEMLVETKRNYRDKYLTSVINRTSAYFNECTGNIYVHVIPPMDGKPFQVETVDQMRYQVNELSQGTIDQLYVCLRLAISEIMSEKHHLPFMIDDAFVHFDAPRTKRIMKILSQIANKQQVIIFTCKEEIRNSLQNSDIIFLT